MASLSLPRVLQQRKTSLELERENFEKFQPYVGNHPSLQYLKILLEMNLGTKEQSDTRFSDFQNKDFTFATFAHPMDADDVNNVPENLQLELIELQEDLARKSQFNNIALTD